MSSDASEMWKVWHPWKSNANKTEPDNQVRVNTVNAVITVNAVNIINTVNTVNEAAMGGNNAILVWTLLRREPIICISMYLYLQKVKYGIGTENVVPKYAQKQLGAQMSYSTFQPGN